MAVITTKYSIGDVVYSASTYVATKQHPCPDCNGMRKWKALSPAGKEYEFACPRCSSSYVSDRDISLNYSAHATLVRKLTIGSVRVDTNPYDGDGHNEYMCLETGVGSGSIYKEANLFETQEAAQAAAEVMAAERDKSSDWIPQLFNKSLSISDYQLTDALVAAAQSRESTRAFAWGDLLEDIESCEDTESIKAAIAKWRKKSQS